MKEIFASQTFGLFGLLFFFGFFIAMVIWLLRPGAKEKAQKNAQIPLQEDGE